MCGKQQCSDTYVNEQIDIVLHLPKHSAMCCAGGVCLLILLPWWGPDEDGPRRTVLCATRLAGILLRCWSHGSERYREVVSSRAS